ncbi:hypothetical protein SAMN05216466_10970 [Paraburkholderia phenazinium]|uniref:Uncharacterized protein n=1 Tax=Paraburkholderia phenazinium TaxID=60549 RepID=A0A1G8BJL2_9BURK|nr:hypothetical protein SAMN05216466_10970 [Paraburkholderia phenazinium]
MICPETASELLWVCCFIVNVTHLARRKMERKKKASRVPGAPRLLGWPLGTRDAVVPAGRCDEQPLKSRYVEAAVGLAALQCNSYAT